MQQLLPGTVSSFKTPHFSDRDFACKCCGRVQIDMGLINALEELQTKVPGKTIIVCGYRCPNRNAARRAQSSGVAKNSWHMQGKAADIRVAELGVSALAAAAGALKAFQRGGIGQYPSDGFVHVDVRGVPYRWEGMNPQLDPDWNPMFGLDDRWPLA